METINLKIPNMKSPHCQMTVSEVINGAGGKIKNIAPGKLEMELTPGSNQEELIQAIRRSGYNAEIEQ